MRVTESLLLSGSQKTTDAADTVYQEATGLNGL